MFSVILYMLRQTVGHCAPLLPFPSVFSSYCDVSETRCYFASTIIARRSQWPRCIRRGSAAAWLLGSRVRIPLWAWMFVCCVYMLCCPVYVEVSPTGLSLVQRSPTLCLYACDQETPKGALCSSLERQENELIIVQVFVYNIYVCMCIKWESRSIVII
jgi:hypothetical protein